MSIWGCSLACSDGRKQWLFPSAFSIWPSPVVLNKIWEFGSPNWHIHMGHWVPTRCFSCLIMSFLVVHNQESHVSIDCSSHCCSVKSKKAKILLNRNSHNKFELYPMSQIYWKPLVKTEFIHYVEMIGLHPIKVGMQEYPVNSACHPIKHKAMNRNEIWNALKKQDGKGLNEALS